MTYLKITTICISIFLLAACSSIPQTHQNGTLTKFDDIADKFSCKVNDSAYEKLTQPEKDALKKKETNCFKDYKNNPELRLLRAELIATVITRYGIAKIEDYSESKEIDTTMLVSKLNPLITKLNQAKTELDNKSNAIEFSDYDVIKADLYVNFIELAIISTRPVRKELQGLLFASNTEKLRKGSKLIRKALETSLYKEAYINQMHKLRKAVTTNPSDYDKAWKKLSGQLNTQCKRIKLTNNAVKPTCDL